VAKGGSVSKEALRRAHGGVVALPVTFQHRQLECRAPEYDDLGHSRGLESAPLISMFGSHAAAIALFGLIASHGCCLGVSWNQRCMAAFSEKRLTLQPRSCIYDLDSSGWPYFGEKRNRNEKIFALSPWLPVLEVKQR